jgi:hypothetical protein
MPFGVVQSERPPAVDKGMGTFTRIVETENHSSSEKMDNKSPNLGGKQTKKIK